MKKYYSVKETASLLGVSTNTIYTYLKEGKLVARRIGKGRFKIPYTSLLPFIDFNNANLEKDVVTDNFQESYRSKLQADILQIDRKREDADVNDDSFESESNDLVFYRLFKALMLLGVGLIYLIINPLKVSSIELFGGTSDIVLIKILPVALIISGLISLVSIIYPNKLKPVQGWIHSFTALVLVYFSLCAICLQNYSSLVFSASLLIVTFLHILKGVSKPDSSNLLDQFAKLVTSLIILGGIVIVLKPENIPFEGTSKILAENKGVFILLWYVTFIPILTLLLSTRKKPAWFNPLFFSLGSILVFIFATQLTLRSVWDSAYMTFLTGIFSLFLSVWSVLGEKVEKRRIFLTAIGLGWISISCLFGIFALHLSQNNIKREMTIAVNSDLEKISTQVNNFFENSGALLTSYAASSPVKDALINKDSQLLTGYAREIFEKVNASQRVIFYDEKGISYGIYPHFNMGLITDYSEREYFKVTKSANKGYVSNFFESILGEKTIIQTEPIFNGNQFLGMIGLGYSLDELSDVFKSDLGDGFVLTVADENGIVIFANDKDSIGLNINEVGVKERLSETDKYITASQGIRNPNWEIYYSAYLLPQFSEKSGLNIAIALIILVNSIFTIGFSLMLSLKEGANITKFPRVLSIKKIAHPV